MVAYMADKQKPLPKTPGFVKKALSSPGVRAVADGENDDVSPADKKRNKLGYHRTAVACGHCRRRKIRCIPSADMTSQRCQNCIRLKKDCQFYPVDQSATTQPKRTRSESKGDMLGNGSETSVSSSSPKVQVGVSIIDQYDHFRAPIETVPISQGAEHEYTHTYDHRQWYSNEPVQHPYWLQHDQNHSNSFAPSPYPITPTTTGPQSLSSQEHAYTYPAPSLDHQQYPHSGQRPRNGPLSPQNGSILPFGGFRANTMPERIGLSGDSLKNHDMQQPAMSVPSQTVMGPPFQPLSGPPTQYPPPASHHAWLPSNPDQQHRQNGYLPPGAPQT